MTKPDSFFREELRNHGILLPCADLEIADICWKSRYDDWYVKVVDDASYDGFRWLWLDRGAGEWKHCPNGPL